MRRHLNIFIYNILSIYYAQNWKRTGKASHCYFATKERPWKQGKKIFYWQYAHSPETLGIIFHLD